MNFVVNFTACDNKYVYLALCYVNVETYVINPYTNQEL